MGLLFRMNSFRKGRPQVSTPRRKPPRLLAHNDDARSHFFEYPGVGMPPGVLTNSGIPKVPGGRIWTGLNKFLRDIRDRRKRGISLGGFHLKILNDSSASVVT